ncbi:hypothetical protein HYFRA_00011129 [Hymenoscyphus fraxineus]|uniref:Copper acquisition factor BIM1-like domain-containing protein n=1 Tax=Hymenoscyphus fraxineus TaxID=746836 RepID=A0A9N9L7K6_9HELO|nr:hypothetical protein HYFRA_00011129 [Hymenoscyphus fraxineus]
MLFQLLTSILTFTTVATSHFTLSYPAPRGDPFAEGASELIYPCANITQTPTTPRTPWPLSGGAISVDLHHSWSYLYINLGFGSSNPSFNISLTPELLNVTGSGTFCLPAVKLPFGLVAEEGQEASLQVVTSGDGGGALYNCADVRFVRTADVVTPGEGVCVNGTGVTGVVCADVRFVRTADVVTPGEGVCVNGTGVTGVVVGPSQCSQFSAGCPGV